MLGAIPRSSSQLSRQVEQTISSPSASLPLPGKHQQRGTAEPQPCPPKSIRYMGAGRGIPVQTVLKVTTTIFSVSFNFCPHDANDSLGLGKVRLQTNVQGMCV